MRISLGFAAARANRSGTMLAPADPIKKSRRESMTTSELGSGRQLGVGHDHRYEGGRFGPAISEATGQAPRFSCIYSAPASCSLKSALFLFFRRAFCGGQSKINPTKT